jgi:hypothetical protein
MDTPALEVEARTVVVRASFAPAQFHPSWFADHGLLRDEEAASADIEILHPDAASFGASWLLIRVTRDSFEASTADSASYEALRDLVIGTFRLMDATQPQAVGLNHNLHYAMPSREYALAVGERLVPTAAWKPVSRPHFKTLIVSGARDEKSDVGTINVRVEGSIVVEGGLYLGINDHFDLSKGSKAQARDTMLELIADEWQPASDRALALADSLIEPDGTD